MSNPKGIRGRLKSSSRAAQTTISLTPLIDVALTLLVIFMVATPMLRRAIKVDLPQGHTNELKKTKSPKSITVYIDKQQKIYINDDSSKKLTIAQAISTIKKLIPELTKQGFSQDMVVVEADEAVPYGVVISLVDNIKHVGGISYVALATQKPAPQK